MRNTGKIKYTRLVQYRNSDNQPTGAVKPNISGDTDFVASVIDYNACPTTTTTTTTIANTVVDVIFPIPAHFSVNIKLMKGDTMIVQRNSAGSWTVPNMIYDGIIFEFSGITHKIQIEVYSGLGQVNYFQLDISQNWNVLLPSNYINLTGISIFEI